MRGGCLALALLLGTVGQARAQRQGSPLAVDPWVDGPVAAVGLVLWITPSLLEDHLARPPCDPCDPRGLNALDRPVVHFDSEAADRMSDVMVVAVPTLALAGTLLSHERWGWSGVAEDSAMIVESVIVSGALQQIVRFAVRRPRPFLYRAGARPELRDTNSATLSFFSGHTAAAFSAASAFAYTYALRHPDSDLKPLVWLLSLMAASAVPLGRVAAGEHFWSDVLVGAAVGTGTGILLPALHRRRLAGARVLVTPGWVGLHKTF